ncbi:MAG: flagellar basal body-associated FliL family protein [Defluviimonas sp.]|uniref:flagellar basal body-associated FliL family protein n=1 Tax=Albidovulum sp. TaxID=1872424 RepID=UPI002A25DECE|nr:flagellar basal body-associated FliL family protein [Defluviimonas sp.]
MKKLLPLLLPLLLALIGAGAGAGAGRFFAAKESPPETAAAGAAAESSHGTEADPAEKAADAHGGGAGPEEGAHEFVKLNNQFVVPIVHSDEVTSLAILSISLEVEAGMSETVFAREPKLRDEFLQVLFEHANAGGFEGNFTSTGRVDALRTALLEAAQAALGKGVSQVLIVDFVRQDS